MKKTFKNMEEMKPYYNEKTNTYEFIENGNFIDIVIDFDLYVDSHIRANDIHAKTISARDIYGLNIEARDVYGRDVIALDDVKAIDINARDIVARNIKAWDITAKNIDAMDIKALAIKAIDIKANNILYESVCYARNTFICNSIKGTRKNSKHFCFDGEMVIKNK